eukprot:10415234-Alexandrium_andersonii.AAC.1
MASSTGPLAPRSVAGPRPAWPDRSPGLDRGDDRGVGWPALEPSGGLDRCHRRPAASRRR